jgi:hypothetical protein
MYLTINWDFLMVQTVMRSAASMAAIAPFFNFAASGVSSYAFAWRFPRPASCFHSILAAFAMH